VRYRQLDEAQIIATIERLRARIAERFPDAGLSHLADELLEIARSAAESVRYLQRPNWPIRVGVGVLIAGMIAVMIGGVLALQLTPRVQEWAQLVQVVESTINDVVFVGVAIFFLLTIEGRLKRRRALSALHELRSVVHIVDMHQLTKDPERLLSGQADTASSPERSMTPGELGRYLDYCSELLSLSSKVAALFMQQLNDPVVLAAVNEIEGLTGRLSNKIWQKITLLGGLPGREETAAGLPHASISR
jgi:hypothetical protein